MPSPPPPANDNTPPPALLIPVLGRIGDAGEIAPATCIHLARVLIEELQASPWA